MVKRDCPGDITTDEVDCTCTTSENIKKHKYQVDHLNRTVCSVFYVTKIDGACELYNELWSSLQAGNESMRCKSKEKELYF